MGGGAGFGAGVECMKPLAPAETLHLRAAQGWLELGNPAEAGGELEKITPAFRAHPDVIELRARIYAKSGKWKESALAALALVRIEPQRVSGWILWARAFRKLQETEGVAEALPAALDAFPAYWRLRFDLACYACELIHKAGEWNWLEQTFDPGGNEKDQAEGGESSGPPPG
jgi:hypothetical protein